MISLLVTASRIHLDELNVEMTVDVLAEMKERPSGGFDIAPHHLR
jgi:hypothetical protein